MQRALVGDRAREEGAQHRHGLVRLRGRLDPNAESGDAPPDNRPVRGALAADIRRGVRLRHDHALDPRLAQRRRNGQRAEIPRQQCQQMARLQMRQ
jgi:hypothetical protein